MLRQLQPFFMPCQVRSKTAWEWVCGQKLPDVTTTSVNGATFQSFATWFMNYVLINSMSESLFVQTKVVALKAISRQAIAKK